MDYLIGLCFFVAAALYASVGHAGASGYIAVMMLAGFPAAMIKPVALILNVFVASFTTWRFGSLGQTHWRLVAPLAVTAIPAAFLGGKYPLPAPAFKLLLAVCLAAAAWRLWRAARPTAVEPETTLAPLPSLLAVGCVVGALSGLSGTGGGIFLTPILLGLRWAPVRIAAGVSAAFILLTSLAGLAGQAVSGSGHLFDHLPRALILWIPCVLAGAAAGTYLSTRRFSGSTLRRALALCLLVAAGKFAADAIQH